MAPFAQKRPLAHQRDPNYKTGRPSDYRQEYCQQVMDYMAKGYSLSAFAGSIKQSRDTMYEWMGTHPEFSDAVTRARAMRLVPWEERLMTVEKSGEVAATIFALKNTDPEEWREVRYANFDHNVKIETLSDEQLLAIASGRREASVGAIDVQYNRLLERPKRFQDPRTKSK
jgi:hypothetical protein